MTKRACMNYKKGFSETLQKDVEFCKGLEELVCEKKECPFYRALPEYEYMRRKAKSEGHLIKRPKRAYMQEAEADAN